MNFGLSDEQREIQSTARDFLADRFRPEVVRELAEARRYDEGLWRQVAELGWPGIAVAVEVVPAADGAAVLVLSAGEEGARVVEPDAATIEPLDLVDTTRRYFRVAAEGGEAIPGDVSGA